MSIPVFRRRRTVGQEHADVWGHVNNVIWLAFAIELAGDHSTAVGLDVEAYRRIGGHFVTHRHEVDYLAAAVPGDELVEETWSLAADMVCKALFDRDMPYNPHVVFGAVKAYTDVMNH